MNRRMLIASLVGAALLLLAAPAWAHEEINPTTVPIGTPVFLTFSAANETESDLIQVTLHAPNGAPFGETTREPRGWRVERTEDEITWTGGRVAPHKFEEWGFEVEGVDQPGRLRYQATLSFANGETEETEVVVAAQAAGGPAPSPSPTETPPSPTPATASPTGGGTTAIPPGGEEATDDTARSRSNLALILAIAGLVTGLGSLALAWRRSGPAAARTEGGTPGREDW